MPRTFAPLPFHNETLMAGVWNTACILRQAARDFDSSDPAVAAHALATIVALNRAMDEEDKQWVAQLLPDHLLPWPLQDGPKAAHITLQQELGIA